MTATPTALAAALAYAAEGLPVFPCKPDSKRPYTENGFYAATTDVKQIAAWWKRWPKAMIGMPTGPTSGRWVLDIDMKKGKDGLATLAELEAAHGPLPETLTAHTPSGGQHRYFRWNGVEIKSRADNIAPGLDTRGAGGYIILAPSVCTAKNSEGTYHWDDEAAAIADAPEWLVELVQGKKKHAGNGAAEPKGKPQQHSEVEEDAEDWVNNIRAGRDLHKSLTKLAMKGVAEGESDAAVIRSLHELMHESSAKRDRYKDWKERYDDIPRAVRTAREKIAAENAERLATMNAENCVVLDGAKACVLRFEKATHIARVRTYTRLVPTFLRPHDFRTLYLNNRVRLGKKFTDLGDWWLRHPERRQYSGVTFEPCNERVIDNRLNLWRGWGVEPKEGDWSLMRRHISEVLAAGDEEMTAYILDWIAWSVQNPAERAEVALVFRGKRGTGKGTLGNALGRLFGQHAKHISSAEHLAGRFNAHMRDCCFLFADEAYGPKDKSAEGTLKRLITEPTLFIEAKGRDPVEVRNMLHVMMASNEDWVVPAGEGERRYAVSNVADTHMQNAAWFDPLYAQLEAGGYGGMLFELLHRDLGDWHPRRIPRNAALAEQQEASLPPLEAWWLELLHTGVLAGADPYDPSQTVSNGYQERVEETDKFGGTRVRTVRRKGLYEQAREMSPKLKGVTDHTMGHFLRDRGCTRTRVLRRRGWQFPTLQQARKEWLARYPSTVWHMPDVTQWTYEGDD